MCTRVQECDRDPLRHALPPPHLTPQAVPSPAVTVRTQPRAQNRSLHPGSRCLGPCSEPPEEGSGCSGFPVWRERQTTTVGVLLRGVHTALNTMDF